MKIAYLLDSTANLNPELKNHPDVFRVNLTIHFPDGSEYVDSENEEERRNFYQKLKKSKSFPTTAQPAPSEYQSVMEEIIEAGYDQVFGIFLSSGLSGTFQTAKTIMHEYSDQIEVYTIDSKNISVVMEDLLKQAMGLVEIGIVGGELNEALEWLAKESYLIAYIETLDYIAKSGRLSNVASFVGNLLKIKPIVTIEDSGELKSIGRARTLRQFFKYADEFVNEKLNLWNGKVNIAVAHGNAPERGEAIYENVSDLVGDDYEINKGIISAVVGCHAGPDVIGVAVMPDYKKVNNL